jgi:hypothetical protein
MLKRKVLLVVALYIILGVIAFFNFGLYRYITGKPGLKITVRYDVREDFDGNIHPPTDDTMESPDSPSDMEINN